MLIKIPHGLIEIQKTFGIPASQGFEQRNIVLFDLPYPLKYEGFMVARARCHRLAVDHFTMAFAAVKEAGLADQFVEFNGIYAHRPIRGSVNYLSLHAWGVAIDMCASQYPLGSSKRMPDPIIKCFREAGFSYGGDFNGRRDPMHFQLATGY